MTGNQFTKEMENLKQTGKENYGLIGNLITKKQAQKVIKNFKGLKLYSSCNVKAFVAAKMLNYDKITYGKFVLIDKKTGFAYGYDSFNVKTGDFHAWIEDEENNIIDFALPGCIRFAKRQGILKDKKPVVLAGQPLSWTIYEAVEHKDIKSAHLFREEDGGYTLGYE